MYVFVYMYIYTYIIYVYMVRAGASHINLIQTHMVLEDSH